MVLSLLKQVELPAKLIAIDPSRSRLARMRSRVLTGARLHSTQVSCLRAALLALTYRPDVAWDHRHVSDCLRAMRRWLKRRHIACHYVWTLETTQASRPHYHVVTWLPLGVKLPLLDLTGWWPHGLTRMEWARCAVGAVSRYIGKGDKLPKLPAGARMYGVGGLEGQALDEARWWRLPAWLRRWWASAKKCCISTAAAGSAPSRERFFIRRGRCCFVREQHISILWGWCRTSRQPLGQQDVTAMRKVEEVEK